VTLSRRTILAVGVTLLVLLGGIYGLASALLLHGFREVEGTHTALNVERARQYLATAEESLSQRLADWSNWDDAYAFVAAPDQAFRDSNLQPESLHSLGIRFIVFVGPDGRVVDSASFGPDFEHPEALPIPDEILARLARPDGGLRCTTPEDLHAGLVTTELGVFRVAARPILNSGKDLPPRGTLLFGEAFDPPAIARMGERLRMTVTLTQTERIAPGSDGDLRRELLADRVRPLVSAIDDDWIRGSTLVADLDGRPAFLLDVGLPRFIWSEARATTHLLGIALAAAGLAALVTIILVLRFVVLAPLGRVHRAVQSIRSSGDLDRRVPVDGADELGDLASTVNGLIERVQRFSEELTAKNAELEGLADQLRAARDAAEAANRSKSEFLASMSHEVRTPMTAILGYADLLASGQAPEGQSIEQCVETIRRNAKHLLTVINDILDLSKIEAGRMNVERIACDPLAVAHEVIDLLGENAGRKGLALRLELRTPIPATIESDPTRLRQILMNLAGNAVKFTASGSVTLALSVLPGRDRLVAEVIDTGIGISPEQRGRLFGAFAQADSSITRLFGGTGLGLAISRKLAELLGGELVLTESGPNGSTFRLEVAAGSAAANAPMVVDPVRPLVAPTCPIEFGRERLLLAGRRVLLAEDGPDNQRLIGFHLGKAGAEVTVVENGRAAVDAITAAIGSGRPFDLLVLDMQMPVLDGYGAARELRAGGVTIPILALTAQAMDGARGDCLAAGCDAYETKPIDRTRLLAACARWSSSTVRRAA
jgi:signal transduction histidine kinase